MVDSVQAVLLFVIIVLTLLLLVLGAQVYFILRELRATVIKANKVLDDTGLITESVSTPIASLSALISGVKTGASIAKLFQQEKPTRRKKDQEDE